MRERKPVTPEVASSSLVRTARSQSFRAGFFHFTLPELATSRSPVIGELADRREA